MKVVALHPNASERFDEFWAEYPLKKRKLVARLKWDAITNGGLETRTLDRDTREYVKIFLKATAQEIIDGAKRYNKKQRDPNTYKVKEFTCWPENWLNQGRWEDD